MDSFYAIKGPGKRLMSFYHEDDRIDLMLYVDGSLSIVRGQAVLGMWEYAEQESCFDELVRLAGGRKRFNAAVILLRSQGAGKLQNEAPSLN